MLERGRSRRAGSAAPHFYNFKMRLTPHQRQVLTEAARDCFDAGVQVRLFGSRADDARRGGDIDLLIQTQLSDPAQISRAHTQFLARVYTALGEQKIDVLIDYPNRQSKAPIYEVAKQGILL